MAPGKKKLDPGIKPILRQLSKAELEKIILAFASDNKGFQDYLLANYIDEQDSPDELFEDARDDIDMIFMKRHKGFSEELRMANKLSSCNKRINEFAKVCGKKNLEADLILYVLEIAFSSGCHFGTCFTAFDFRVSLLLKRLITLVTKKMHTDYRLDYQEKINEYLRRLHSTSNHINSIYAMPAAI